ncbi:MAG: 2-pyrone-4,6-dicarboxylate hydrolase, partial [Desulfuromonas sp.]
MSLSRELANVRVFDAHMHIIDKRFPLVENNGYLPDEFTAKDYLAACGTFDLVGGAVVSGSFQAFDQGYLVAALKELGDGFVGVTQVPATVSDQEILDLAAAGVRAVRFNVKRGGSEELSQLEGLAERVYDLAGWHVEFYIDAAILDPLKERLVRLPAASIDHLGLSQAGFKTLLWLAEHGDR